MSLTLTKTERLSASAQIGGREIICDGINPNLVNLATPREWGIRPPAADATLAESANDGVVTAGVHLGAVTFGIQDEDGHVVVESNAKSFLTVTSTGTKKLAWTSLPLSDNAAVNCRVLYLTLADGTELRRVHVLADNTTTTYELDVADAAIGDLVYSPANEVLPAKPFCLAVNNQLILAGDVVHTAGTVDVEHESATATFHEAGLTRAMEGRYLQVGTGSQVYILTAINVSAQTATLSAAYGGTTATGQPLRISHEPSTLYLSNPIPGNVEGYNPLDANQVIDIFRDDNDPITALGLSRNNIVIGKQSSLFLMVGTPSKYDLVRLSSTVGAASHFAGVTLDSGEYLFYAGANGLYLVRDNEPIKISPPGLDPWFADAVVNRERDPLCHAVWDKVRRWYWLWTCDVDKTYHDRVLIADFSNVSSFEGAALSKVRYWEFQLPASSSHYTEHDGTGYVLLGNYHGQVWVYDAGDSDMADAVTREHTLTVVDDDELTVANLGLGETDPPLAGVRVTILTGAAAGDSRLIKSATNTVLTLDLAAQFGGAWAVPPEVGDRIRLGAIPSLWTSPDFTMAAPHVQKRFLEWIGDWEFATAPLAFRQYTETGGQFVYRGQRWLPADKRHRTVVPLGQRAPRWVCQLAAEDADWSLRGISLTAAGKGESR